MQSFIFCFLNNISQKKIEKNTLKMEDRKNVVVTFDNQAFKIDSDESKNKISNRYAENIENEFE